MPGGQSPFSSYYVFPFPLFSTVLASSTISQQERWHNRRRHLAAAALSISSIVLTRLAREEQLADLSSYVADMSASEVLRTLATLGPECNGAALERFVSTLVGYLPPEHIPAAWFCSPDTDNATRLSYISSLFPVTQSDNELVSNGGVEDALQGALALPGLKEKSKVAIRKYLKDPSIGLALCLVFACPEAEGAVALDTLQKFSTETLEAVDPIPSAAFTVSSAQAEARTEAEAKAKALALRTVASLVDASLFSENANLGDNDINAIKWWVKSNTRNKNANGTSAAKAAAIVRLAKLLLLCPLPDTWNRAGGGNAGIGGNNVNAGADQGGQGGGVGIGGIVGAAAGAGGVAAGQGGGEPLGHVQPGNGGDMPPPPPPQLGIDEALAAMQLGAGGVDADDDMPPMPPLPPLPPPPQNMAGAANGEQGGDPLAAAAAGMPQGGTNGGGGGGINHAGINAGAIVGGVAALAAGAGMPHGGDANGGINQAGGNAGNNAEVGPDALEAGLAAQQQQQQQQQHEECHGRWKRLRKEAKQMGKGLTKLIENTGARVQDMLARFSELSADFRDLTSRVEQAIASTRANTATIDNLRRTVTNLQLEIRTLRVQNQTNAMNRNADEGDANVEAELP